MIAPSENTFGVGGATPLMDEPLVALVVGEDEHGRER
jgi:hypothetical protein